jgi:hypothetical protein
MNVNLNAGGVITGILALCVGVGWMLLSKEQPGSIERLSKLTIAAVIGGALCGNVAWIFVFRKSEDRESTDGDDKE